LIQPPRPYTAPHLPNCNKRSHSASTASYSPSPLKVGSKLGDVPGLRFLTNVNNNLIIIIHPRQVLRHRQPTGYLVPCFAISAILSNTTVPQGLHPTSYTESREADILPPRSSGQKIPSAQIIGKFFASALASRMSQVSIPIIGIPHHFYPQLPGILVHSKNISRAPATAKSNQETPPHQSGLPRPPPTTITTPPVSPAHSVPISTEKVHSSHTLLSRTIKLPHSHNEILTALRKSTMPYKLSLQLTWLAATSQLFLVCLYFKVFFQAPPTTHYFHDYSITHTRALYILQALTPQSTSLSEGATVHKLYKLAIKCINSEHKPTHKFQSTNIYTLYLNLAAMSHVLVTMPLGLYNNPRVSKATKRYHSNNIVRVMLFRSPLSRTVPPMYRYIYSDIYYQSTLYIYDLSSPPAGGRFAAGGLPGTPPNCDRRHGTAGDRIPRARCNDYCPPGTRKAPNGGYHTCCYDCIPCNNGEFSNVTESDNCQKCPDNEWTDQRKVTCIPKMYDFLSYEKEIMGPLFASISSLCLFVTIVVLRIFFVFRNTPIVRANNRSLSFILLVSIILSFLCVFLFLGNPVYITCMLRQTCLGVTFSVAVSSILGKTIMVCIAFKATKPGSSWRKWVGVKVSSYVVMMCTSVQVLINVIWLSVSPPFQEFDMHSYPTIIIIQCNEGSVLAFYCVLGYMGMMASMSFVLAFMVRTLPDSFNEAKYITFSMLVFCSVWIAMIPAYLSTKGKYMVAVEIFAILASSAGILSCIYFPKCYILLRKPEMNTRKHILDRHNS
ncbi:vomeronasal type-2 receptor 26-like, partial [Pelobates cultripes]